MSTRGGMVLTVLAAAAAVLVASAALAQETPKPAENPYAGKTVGDVTKESGDNGKKAPPVLPGLETVLRMLLWLGVVVVFIYAAVWLMRKYMPSARGMFGAGALKVVSRSYVSAKQSILLVKVGERFVLIGVTPASMTPLTEIADPEEARRLTEELAASQEGAHSKSFRAALRGAESDAAKAGGAADPRDAAVREVSREIDAVREKINDWRGKTKS